MIEQLRGSNQLRRSDNRRCGYAIVVTILLGLCTIRAQQPTPEATPQRPTFSNDTATTAPGTLEIEFGAKGPGGTLTIPAEVKFTPAVERGLFHQMEFSLGFDPVERVVVDEDGEIKFSETLDFVMRKPVWSGNGLSFALAPRAEFFLRDRSGALIGAKAIAVYGFGLNSLVLNILGKGATAPSKDNPDWVAEVVLGYGRALGGSGTASRFTIAFEMENGFSKGQKTTLSLLQGISYRARPNLVFDLEVEQRGLRAGEFVFVLAGGLTYNFGRIWR